MNEIDERELRAALDRPRAGEEASAEALAHRFSEAAAASGDAEIAYARYESPLGSGLIAATQEGLLRLALPNETPERMLEELSGAVSPRLVEAPARLAGELRQLEEYFAGRRRHFELALDWRLVGSSFRRGVLEATAAIPYGEVITYSEAAARAGNRRASRAAGSALGSNPIPIVVPCHRVVRAGGALGNYGGGPEMKAWLLRMEGVAPAV